MKELFSSTVDRTSISFNKVCPWGKLFDFYETCFLGVHEKPVLDVPDDINTYQAVQPHKLVRDL